MRTSDCQGHRVEPLHVPVSLPTATSASVETCNRALRVDVRERASRHSPGRHRLQRRSNRPCCRKCPVTGVFRSRPGTARSGASSGDRRHHGEGARFRRPPADLRETDFAFVRLTGGAFGDSSCCPRDETSSYSRAVSLAPQSCPQASEGASGENTERRPVEFHERRARETGELTVRGPRSAASLILFLRSVRCRPREQSTLRRTGCYGGKDTAGGHDSAPTRDRFAPSNPAPATPRELPTNRAQGRGRGLSPRTGSQ
jgi:hypothetical protein